MKNLLFIFAMVITLFACQSEPSTRQIPSKSEVTNTKGKVLFIVSNELLSYAAFCFLIKLFFDK